MNFPKEKLTEKILLFLYALSNSSEYVNVNTFKRYIYLYYLTSSFINEVAADEENITIIVNKGDITIIGYDSIINDLNAREFIDIEENRIIVRQELKDYLLPFLNNDDGTLNAQYREILPFVNILKSYNDQYIFTIFFSEPTFQAATARGLSEISSESSELKKLLSKFKTKVNDANIDEYDILAYWMDFILKNYYIEMGECHA